MVPTEIEFSIESLSQEIGSTDFAEPRKLGPYTVGKRDILGEGAMGIVFRATNQVAIKLGRSSDPYAFAHHRRSAQFQSEIASATSHVPKVYGVETVAFNDKEYPLIVMGFAGEGTLRDKFAEGPLGVSEVSRRLESVGEAVDVISGRGLVHRDIKPGNMVNGKVVDFDTICAIGTTAQTGLCVGTAGYLAPEQSRRGDKFTDATDRYAVAATAFHGLSGAHAAADIHEYQGAIMQGTLGDYVINRIERANITSNVKDVLRKAHAEYPSDRFAFASDFLTELSSCTTKQTVIIDLGTMSGGATGSLSA